MKIGLYFGTFNSCWTPNHCQSHENSDLDQVWLVVTPHNRSRKKAPCSMTYHQMAPLLQDFPKLKPSDIEFKLSQPNYTVTLVHLEENTPIMNFR
jgi:nicotinate-nucleotide adenylyltransferase